MNDGNSAGPPAGEHSAHPAREEIAEYAEGLLDPDGELALSDHLAACTSCRQFHAQLADVTAALAGVPDPGPPPAAALARIEAALAREVDSRLASPSGAIHRTADPPQERHRRRWLPRLVTTAAILSLAAVGYAAIPPSGDDSATDTSISGAAQPESAEGEYQERTGGDAAVPQLTRSADEDAVLALGQQILNADRDDAAGSPAEAGAECGEQLAQALERHLIGSATILWRGNQAELIVVSGSADSSSGGAEALVVSDCTAGPADVLYTTPLNTP